MHRKNFHIVPHEAVFGAFLVITWIRLIIASGPWSSSSLFYMALILIEIGLIAYAERHPTTAATRIRLLFFAVTMNLVFPQMRTAIPMIHPEKMDVWLQSIDRALIGTDISVYLERCIRPGLTEALSFCYMLFFPYLLFSLLWYLFDRVSLAKIFYAGLFTVYGIGFLGYSLVPAEGPYLAMADHLHTPLAGGILTRINSALVLAGSNRVDVFPSLHCAVSCYFLLFDWRHKRWRFYGYVVPCIGLWAATLYLRYHYLIDVIMGFLLAAVGLIVAAFYEREVKRHEQNPVL